MKVKKKKGPTSRLRLDYREVSAVAHGQSRRPTYHEVDDEREEDAVDDFVGDVDEHAGECLSTWMVESISCVFLDATRPYKSA